MQKQIKKLNFLIYILFLGFITFSFAFAFALKTKSNEIQQKDMAINVLIDEVGSLKQNVEKNDKVAQQLKIQNDTLINYVQELNLLIDKELVKNKTQNAEVSAEFKSKEQELTNLLVEKESIIKDLYLQNSTLGDQIISKAINTNTKNILLLGNNAGLMDTILVASINQDSNKISMISIPRDLYINGRKINELYTKYGIEKLSETVKDVTGIQADTYAIWDFTSFITLIDELGGITINVEKDLYDSSYPDGYGGYSVVSFKKGEQTMDGSQALKYARSRKSTSDFDRAKRQQKVIKAVIQQIKDKNLISKVDMALRIYAKIKPSIETNLDFFSALSLFNKYSAFTFNESFVLSTSNYLVSSTSSTGQYILSPKSGNYTDIHNSIFTLLK